MDRSTAMQIWSWCNLESSGSWYIVQCTYVGRRLSVVKIFLGLAFEKAA